MKIMKIFQSKQLLGSKLETNFLGLGIDSFLTGHKKEKQGGKKCSIRKPLSKVDIYTCLNNFWKALHLCKQKSMLT